MEFTYCEPGETCTHSGTTYTFSPCIFNSTDHEASDIEGGLSIFLKDEEHNRWKRRCQLTVASNFTSSSS